MRVTKGTYIRISIYAAHRNPDFFPEPDEFRPERFLNERGDLNKIKDEFVPFSFGRRACLGESLAKAELFLFISAVCQRFDILPVDKDNLPPLEEVFGAAVGPRPFPVKFVSRNI